MQLRKYPGKYLKEKKKYFIVISIYITIKMNKGVLFYEQSKVLLKKCKLSTTGRSLSIYTQMVHDIVVSCEEIYIYEGSIR